MVGEMADEGLVRGSLSKLYTAYAADGIHLAFRLTGDRALAEDLVQDAFARLVGRLRHLGEPNAFWAYLRRTIVNLATSRLRRLQVERAYLDRLAAAPAADTNDNDELDETMHRVLLGLPQRQRAAVAMTSRRRCSSSRVRRRAARSRPRWAAIRRPARPHSPGGFRSEDLQRAGCASSG